MKDVKKEKEKVRPTVIKLGRNEDGEDILFLVDEKEEKTTIVISGKQRKMASAHRHKSDIWDPIVGMGVSMLKVVVEGNGWNWKQFKEKVKDEISG